MTRRYVFLCPTSLNKHFEAVPAPVKESSLLVFRCARHFLFKDPPAVRKARVMPRVDCGSNAQAKKQSDTAGLQALYRTHFSDDFLKWVLIKEKEGCVYFYKPDRDLPKLSEFFEEKIDPMDEQPYRPLLLDPMWWRIRFDRTSARYIGNPRSILSAISDSSGILLPEERDIELPALQELIFQSNPTLEPILKWPHAPSMRYLPKTIADSKAYKGYIVSAVRDAGGENGFNRISKWPEKGQNRLDNLHHHWQVEAMSSARRGIVFQNSGMTSLGKKSGALTAR